MSLRLVNLNLLPILRVLLKEASVTRAADVLGLSQSGVSEALGRLREVLDDHLLVQVGRTMRLTPYAVDLIEPVERLCVEAELLLQKRRFDPADSNRRFRIAASDFGVTEICPRVIEMRKRFAPGICADFIDFHRSSLDHLATLDLDFAWIASFYIEDTRFASLRSLPLQSYPMMAVFEHDHPLAHKVDLTRADLEAWPMIGLNPEPGLFKPGRLQHLLGGLKLNIAFSIEHSMLQALLLKGSGCWTLLPQPAAAATCIGPDLVTRRVSALGIPDAEVCLVWSAIHDSDPAHRWFRETLAELVNGPGATYRPD